MSKTYSVYLNSNDKIVGSNSNAQFNVCWDTILPKEYANYDVTFNFQTTSGNYTNIGMCRIDANFQNSSYSYDSATNGVSNCLGYVYKDSYNCFNNQSNFITKKCMPRPTKIIITIKIYNNNNATNLLVDTPVIMSFKSGMSTTTLTVDSTISPLSIIETNSVITGYGVAAGTTIVMRANAYTYTISSTNNTINQQLLMTSANVPTDMTAWTLILNFTPVI